MFLVLACIKLNVVINLFFIIFDKFRIQSGICYVFSAFEYWVAVRSNEMTLARRWECYHEKKRWVNNEKREWKDVTNTTLTLTTSVSKRNGKYKHTENDLFKAKCWNKVKPFPASMDSSLISTERLSRRKKRKIFNILCVRFSSSFMS